ncbi:SDR family NAD(P)-dependent oxidoreductase [Nostocales cyanobacterium LEGE 12452]|nr:SDR family NAD(P)-dependent oxidoreductase [Nostocales cyanobacterium LEGE 12452]
MQTPIKASKTVIITGGNSGLGYYCAQAIALSKQDWHIIIASRNLPRVEEAVQQLTAETNYSFIEGMTLDLASLASVRQFVQDFQTREHPPLEAIVCNAGVQIVSGTRYTENGFEMTFGVNHLGHFLLVNLLLPHLSERSRIVFVSSDTHNPETNTGMPHPNYQDANALAFPTGDDNQMDMRTVGRVRYTTSKLCNLLCTYELSRRLQKQQSKITVNAFNPGLMLDTKLSRDYSESERSALRATLSASTLEQSRDSQVMGSALARLILDPALLMVTGRYFDGLKEIRSSDESYDEQKAVELWETSVGLTH